MEFVTIAGYNRSFLVSGRTFCLNILAQGYNKSEEIRMGETIMARKLMLDLQKCPANHSLMNMLPNTIEPMISWAVSDKTLISEIYLRMTCAVTYHNCGNDSEAIKHIDRAIALSLPDKLYGLLAEYVRTLDALLEHRLTLIDEEAWERVRALGEVYNHGWSKLSGTVRGRQILTTLSRRQREIIKLAAFGLKNHEIASKLHISIAVVKHDIELFFDEYGISRDRFAEIL